MDNLENYLARIWPDDGICVYSGMLMRTDVRHTHDDYPEPDQIIPGLGYVEGNIVWVRRRMNRLKNNATLQELKWLYEGVQKQLAQKNAA